LEETSKIPSGISESDPDETTVEVEILSLPTLTEKEHQF
jgi:hypothetical protein